MTTRRPAPPKASRESPERIREPSGRLDPDEEKVIRMRRGLIASDDQPLEFMGRGHPDTLARLREIEHRAFEKSGRLAALKKEAGLDQDDLDEEDEPEAQDETKEKIVAALKEKAAPKAKAVVKAKSKPSTKKR
jgi:hypothetical protein